MNYKDHWATDADGNQFLFTVELQRQLSRAGLPVEPDSISHLDSAGGSDKHSGSSHTQISKGDQGDTRADEDEISFEEPEAIQIDPLTGKYIGRVKWYNVTKGYGFISRGGGEDIFFHKTDVVKDADNLLKGDWILYDVEETPKGLEASDVEVYESNLTLS